VKTGEIGFVSRNQQETLRYLLRLADVENARIKYEHAIGLRELAKQLGVDSKLVNRLVHKESWRKKPRRTVDGYHTLRLDPEAAIKLLNSYI
jgi:hypothetical protein